MRYNVNRTKCARGHSLIEPSSVYVRMDGGKERKECMECRKIRRQEYKKPKHSLDDSIMRRLLDAYHDGVGFVEMRDRFGAASCDALYRKIKKAKAMEQSCK